MLKNLSRNWTLDPFFVDGSDSVDFKKFLDELEVEVKGLHNQITEANTATGKVAVWTNLLDAVQKVALKLRHASAFVGCLTAANTKDQKAKILGGRVRQINAAYSSVLSIIDERILELSEEQWNNLIANEELKELQFNLKEMRRRAADKMSTELETLVNDLSVDGYHAWNNVYQTVVGNIEIPVERDGKMQRLSAGQAANVLSHPDYKVREDILKKWEDAWSESADMCATALNHLSGFRINLYRQRGWEDVLKETLDMNRMSRSTLDAMWDTIDDNKARLVKFMDRKRELLPEKKLTFWNLSAPIGETQTTVDFDQAANFIVGQVKDFSPRVADLYVHAFENNWVESEDRANKRTGAFCTSSPFIKQSRVFMTFSGSMKNVSTLAHELGHAYHQSVMNELPPLSQRYAMNVAETASTFSEMIVSDAALKAAQSKEEKISLLNDKLQRAVILMMNIQSRFLFETRFYAKRKKGLLSVEELNNLMVQAQQDAFGNSLDVYHPHFWASKLHFYNTGVPFYNFPYTFGFLFSAGVYAQALEQGEKFEQNYINLLRDTGRMQVEDLAQTHLGVDLTSSKFWQSAINMVTAELDEFLTLTK